MAETSSIDNTSLWKFVENSFGKNIKTYITAIPTRILDNISKLETAKESFILTSTTTVIGTGNLNKNYVDNEGVFSLYYCDYNGKLNRLTYPVHDKDILETIAVSLTDLNTRISALESASKS